MQYIMFIYNTKQQRKKERIGYNISQYDIETPKQIHALLYMIFSQNSLHFLYVCIIPNDTQVLQLNSIRSI